MHLLNRPSPLSPLLPVGFIKIMIIIAIVWNLFGLSFDEKKRKERKGKERKGKERRRRRTYVVFFFLLCHGSTNGYKMVVPSIVYRRRLKGNLNTHARTRTHRERGRERETKDDNKNKNVRDLPIHFLHHLNHPSRVVNL